MRSAALAFLCVLAACGGGSEPNTTPDGLFIGPPPSGYVYVVVVPVGSFPDARLAEFAIENGDGWIRVREDTVASDLARRLVRHELGHALGLAHTADTACVMHPDAFQNPALGLCPAEIGHAQGFPGTLTLSASLSPPALYAIVDAAADEWNAAAGRVIVSLP